VQYVTGNRRHESQSLRQIEKEAKCVNTVLCGATLDVLTAVLLKFQVSEGCDVVWLGEIFLIFRKTVRKYSTNDTQPHPRTNESSHDVIMIISPQKGAE
jgi:hypothetical protein